MSEMDTFSVHFDGKEYDIKRFLKDHPGGIRMLQNYKGKSISEGMERFEHSNSAYHMLNDFKLGDSGDEGEHRDANDNVAELKDSNLTGGVSVNGRIITKEELGRNRKEVKFLEELENRLDWSQPLLHQLDKIAPHYDTWVNSSVYRQLRLFESPLLESLTYTPWYLVPIFWIPVIFYLAVSQLHLLVLCGDECGPTSLSVLEYMVHVAVGVMVWTIVEYSLHRWVFHLDPGNSLIMIKIHFLIHGMHHKVPFDGLRQVFPPIPAMFLASLLYIPVRFVFANPLVIMTGGLIGYLTYDMIHYYVHHGAPSDGSYLYTMKRYHSNHHFVNHDKAYGISNKLWDYAFRTVAQVRKLGFSLHW